MRLLPTAAGFVCLICFAALPGRADEPDDATPPAPAVAAPIITPADKTLHPGESEVYEFDGMTTAAVGSPLVADIVPLSARRLLVNAKGVGRTTLFVYDRRGRHRLLLAVVPIVPDLAPAAAQVQAEIGLPGVTARALGDTVFLEGVVTSVVTLQRASAIAGVYAPKFKNLLAVVPVKDDSPSLAQTYAALLTDHLKDTQIKVQVLDEKTIALSGEYAPARAAVSEEPVEPKARRRVRERVKKASADSASADDGDDANAALDLSDPPTPAQAEESLSPDPLDRLLASLPSELKVVNLLNVASRPTQQILVHAKIISIDRNATKNLGVNWGTLYSSGGRNGNAFAFQPQPILFGQNSGGYFSQSAFGGAPLQRISPLAAQLNVLISENKARVLSEPSLMVLDGHEGSILVGGEIPVPVAQASSGTNGVSASVSVEYKSFGVKLAVGAALVGDNAVQMTVSPEVSELNYAAAVQISGYVVPGLSVRRATTTLQMADGETLVIGGLYSNTATRHVERIPLLSQIPVLGEFFKNTTTQKEETELLILIQPEIVKPGTLGAHPPAPGSAENPAIQKPAVGAADFDKDFPDLQKGGGDKPLPGPPINLPPIGGPK